MTNFLLIIFKIGSKKDKIDKNKISRDIFSYFVESPFALDIIINLFRLNLHLSNFLDLIRNRESAWPILRMNVTDKVF